jgi:hypothetical protein
MNGRKIVFGTFFIIGLGLLLGAAVAVKHTRNFLRIAHSTQGIVVQNVLRESGGGKHPGRTRSYFPRIRFQTASGREIDFLSNTGSRPPAYSVNQQVTVLYDPHHPEKASIDSFGDLWMGTILLAVLGAIFTVPVLGHMAWSRVTDPRNEWLHRN